MLRSSSQSLLRSFSYRAASESFRSSRRYLSNTSTRYGPQSWKTSVVRWALAGGAVYYYNTSDVFAEEPVVRDGNAQLLSDRVENMPTVDRVVEERRKRAAEAAVARTPTAPIQTSPSMQTSENTIPADAVEDAATPQAGSPEELEEEAESEGAFNPETGEINWDCPCLGGMAHGPCGEEFKAAFSCFVYSEQEPKGMDCIEKFKDMQNCFRQHPDVYGEELDEDEGDVEEPNQTSSVGTAPHVELSSDKPISPTLEGSENLSPSNQSETKNHLETDITTK